MEELAKPGFLAGVAETGAYLSRSLETLSAKHGCGRVRGRGLLLALDLGRPIGTRVADLALERGLLINSPRPDSLRFMPSLTVSRGEIDQLIGLLDGILQGVTA
jgi:acetylornithine/N-succinyldiaminopimelate aminotransferase